MAILQSKDFVAGKNASTGPYAGMSRDEIVLAKIKDGKPFKLGSTGNSGQVIGLEYNPKTKQFTYQKTSGKKEIVTVSKITGATGNIFKDSDFGGGGGAGGGTIQTAYAESAQCVWLIAVQKSPRKKYEDFTEKDLKAAFDSSRCQVGSTTFDQIMTLGPDWHKSGYWTAKKLIEMKLVNTGQTYHRDSTVMKKIYKNKKTAFQNSDLTVLSDDKWNPGDFWAVKTNFDVNKMDYSTIKAYNNDLLKRFKDRTVMGISLKKIARGNVKASILNETNERPAGVKFKKSVIATARGTFFTSKGGFILFDGPNPGSYDNKMEIRTNAALSTHKVEIILKTARGGGAGWGIIQDIVKQVNGTNLPDNRMMLSMTDKIIEGNSSEIDKLWEKTIKCGGYDSRKKDDFLEELKKQDRIWIHGKLGVVELLYELENTTTKKADSIVNKIYNYAGSVSDLSSVYVKVYE